MNPKKIFIIYSLLATISLSTFCFANEYKSIFCGKDTDINRKIYIFNKHDSYYNIVSPFHDIPLFSDEDKNLVNMVVEIPKGAQEKIEINKTDKFNPLKYDIKNEKIRKITYKAKNTSIAGYPYNYGALPQTWEHMGTPDPHTEMYGDNDLNDAFDISQIPAKPGSVIEVKVLGAIAMIDNKETDWKLVVINTKDKLASKYDNISDLPFGIIYTIYDFLLNYKTSEGKPQNEFYVKQMFWDKDEALEIIDELHRDWQKLCYEPKKTMELVKKNQPEKVDEIPKCQINKNKTSYKKPFCPM